MINGPPGRMRSGPDGLDATLAVDLDHQATIHNRRNGLTAAELPHLLSDDEPSMQECPEIPAQKRWSFPGHSREQVFGAMRSRQHEHAVKTRVHRSGNVGIEPIPH